jgi:hypothetical protein
MQVFVKGLLDKLKVQPEVFRREEYKVDNTAHHTILVWIAYLSWFWGLYLARPSCNFVYTRPAALLLPACHTGSSAPLS